MDSQSVVVLHETATTVAALESSSSSLSGQDAMVERNDKDAVTHHLHRRRSLGVGTFALPEPNAVDDDEDDDTLQDYTESDEGDIESNLNVNQMSDVHDTLVAPVNSQAQAPPETRFTPLEPTRATGSADSSTTRQLHVQESAPPSMQQQQQQQYGIQHDNDTTNESAWDISSDDSCFNFDYEQAAAGATVVGEHSVDLTQSQLPTVVTAAASANRPGRRGPFAWPDANEDSKVWSRQNRHCASVVPFLLCTLAVIFTLVASWDCQYFTSAVDISFTGDSYGLWTLSDVTGQCQLWDVLFFSYTMGPTLHSARCASMVAQVLGLAILALLTQALSYQVSSCLILTILTLAFASSVMLSTGLYNLWMFFFLFTYIMFLLIVRYCFVHPVRRHISQRGFQIVALCAAVCAVASWVTLVVLLSDFCRCGSISSATLAGRDPPNPEDCNGSCTLGVSGYLFIWAGVLWALLAANISYFGLLQPDENAGRRRTSSRSFMDLLAAAPSSDNLQIEAEPGQANHAVDSKDGDNAAAAPKILLAPYRRDSITTRTVEVLGTVRSVTQSLVRSLQRRPPPPPPQSHYFDDTEASNRDVAASNEENQKKEAIRDTRNCCQKICFDYRISQRTCQEKCLFWLLRFTLAVLIFFYVLIVILMIGSYQENTDAAKAPDTSYNFITDIVCAFNASDPTQPFQTFPTKALAVLANMTVAHCGACGMCSNPYDIQQYVVTRKSVARLAKQCGALAVIGTYAELTECLQERIGFSLPCTKCWSDNMMSTANYCLFACMKTTLTGLASTNNVIGLGDTVWLNQCIYCDEKRSGPQFVKCSGVARRRLGIRSEIERDPAEQCTKMDVDWVNVDWNQTFPQLTNRS
jgi:hypothetical protein